jgi:iron complex transport system ATP-binding protein
VTTALLRVSDVGWQASAPVLEHVSFDVAAGELVAVVGRNGAGKSTLLDILAGLRSPTAGTVTLGGQPLATWTPAARARMLAHLPQSVRADLSTTADALVLMGRYPHAGRWFESDEDRRIASEAMDRCGCLRFVGRPLATLSGGERQRVFLAACLAQQARLLLLDEPATYLDVDQQLSCFTVLREEADRGVACVAVTHDLNLALTFCTRLIVLAGGRIAADLSAAAAVADAGWLSVFSERLMLDTAGARPWVRYR